jgi:hypothetical protein
VDWDKTYIAGSRHVVDGFVWQWRLVTLFHMCVTLLDLCFVESFIVPGVNCVMLDRGDNFKVSRLGTGNAECSFC